MCRIISNRNALRQAAPSPLTGEQSTCQLRQSRNNAPCERGRLYILTTVNDAGSTVLTFLMMVEMEEKLGAFPAIDDNDGGDRELEAEHPLYVFSNEDYRCLLFHRDSVNEGEFVATLSLTSTY